MAVALSSPAFTQVQDARAQSSDATPPAVPAQLTNTVSAPPFKVIDKFDYRVVQTFGLRGFLGAGVGAAIGDARNSPYEWGQGTGGFAKRYGSSFAGNLSRQVFEINLEAAFHEDPRYFPSQGKSRNERLVNVRVRSRATGEYMATAKFRLCGNWDSSRLYHAGRGCRL